MTPNVVDMLACPRDGAFPLQLRIQVAGSSGEVEMGSLDCAQCRHRYCIVEGIPDLVYLGEDDTDVEIKKAEIDARDADAPVYDADITPYQTKVELDAIIRGSELSETSRVLELGCGTGRISLPLLAQCGDFVGVDFSLASLRQLKSKVGKRPGFDVIRADLNHMPLRSQPAFDRVVSVGVFEHLPTQQLRRNFLAHSREFLYEDGHLVLTTYNFNWSRQYKKIPKIGFHDSGIYYYCYDTAELRREIIDFFHVKELSGLRNIPLRIRRLLGDTLGERFDRLVARVHLDRLMGDFVLVVASPLVDNRHDMRGQNESAMKRVEQNS